MWNIGPLADSVVHNTAPARALADLYVPLKDRLSAWWTGDEPAHRGVRTPGNFQIEVDDESDSDLIWPPSRLQITQDVFGEGFTEPGGAAFARKLLSPADIDSTKTVLDLAVGLGGTACTIVREQNVWLEGYEPDAVLAEHARALARSYMISKRVNVSQIDYGDFALKQQKYDVIFARERLFTTQKKTRILSQSSHALKKSGKLLIVDYLIKSHDSETQTYREWIGAEREHVFPWTEQQYSTEFERANLKLRVSQDFSAAMVEQIETAWQKVLRLIEGGNVDRAYVNALIREGELWLARSRALEKGDITLTRFLATPK